MLNAFNKLFTPKTTKIALKKGIRGRLELVSLEERVVPAAFTVVNNSDSGVGSLRQAILDANATTANDIINFSVVNSPLHHHSGIPLCLALQLLIPQAHLPSMALALPRLPPLMQMVATFVFSPSISRR